MSRRWCGGGIRHPLGQCGYAAVKAAVGAKTGAAAMPRERLDIASSRRVFMLGGAAALWHAAGLAAPARSVFTARRVPIGIQLFTVRAELSSDLDGTLRKLAAIGFETVEIAGYAGRTPAALRAAFDRAGLRCTSAHVPGRRMMPGPSLEDDPGELAESCHRLGCNTVRMPFFYIPDRIQFEPRPGEDMPTAISRAVAQMNVDDWKWNADYLNRKAAALKPHGIRFGYHNHNIEFMPIGGATPFDILVRDTDPLLVSLEIDVGWVAAAGLDPVSVIERLGSRVTALHVKDLRPSTRPNFAMGIDPAEVGSGIIDWPRMLAVADRANIQQFFVEQEPPFASPPLEAMARSFDYLSRIMVLQSKSITPRDKVQP